jgi:polysaccharide deacetylase 2 family uncharacterized protein YibQ
MRRTLSLPLTFLVVLIIALAVFLLIEIPSSRHSKLSSSASSRTRATATMAPPAPPPAAGTLSKAPGRGTVPVSKPPKSKAAAAPKAAIIMDDMGNSLESIRALCALGRPITAAVLPFAAETRPTIDAAAACGLEVMLHLPLESLGKPRRTPEGTISAGMTPEEVRRGVQACLDQVPGCVGVNNHAGSKVTEDGATMPVILEVIREKGLYFIDSRTTSASVAYEAARRLGIRAAGRDVFLDGTLDETAIKARIEELFRIARDRGRAVGICHPKPETLAALRKYIALAGSYGVTLVFASEIVEQP